MTTNGNHSKFPSTAVAVGVVLLFVGLSYVLHRYFFWSPMVLAEEAWLKKLELHTTWAPFAVRPLQSYATIFLHSIAGLPIRESFFALQFTLATILGIAFYVLLDKLGFAFHWRLIGLLFLFTAYPIAGAHFAPTHTWDDFWCYLFLVLAVLALFKDRPILAGPSFFIALVAREQAVLYLLLFAIWCYPLSQKKNRQRLLLVAVAPIVLFLVYRLIIWEPIDPTRWTLYRFNFSTPAKTVDTTASLIISFGFLWALAIAGMFVRIDRKKNRALAAVKMAMPFILLANVAMTLTMSFARETRIFFPPFVLVIPVALLYLRSVFVSRYTYTRWLILILCLLIGSGLAIEGTKVTASIFANFDYAANSELRRPLAGVHLGLMAALIIFWIGRGIWKLTSGSKKRSPAAKEQIS